MDDGNRVHHRTCGFEGCTAPHYGLGLCNKHWQRLRHHGDPSVCHRRKTTNSYLDGEVGYIELTQGRWAIVDAKHFDYINQWRWQYSNGYARRSGQRNWKKFCISMHEVIAKRMGYDVVDHKFHSTLDNRESQLRPASFAQNQQNRRQHSHWRGRPVSSRFKGVYWYKERKKWAAQIKVRGKRYPLGRYEVEEDAAIAYNVAAQIFFGEFAWLNPV
jgi:hypothetical protein